MKSSKTSVIIRSSVCFKRGWFHNENHFVVLDILQISFKLSGGVEMRTIRFVIILLSWHKKFCHIPKTKWRLCCCYANVVAVKKLLNVNILVQRDSPAQYLIFFMYCEVNTKTLIMQLKCCLNSFPIKACEVNTKTLINRHFTSPVPILQMHKQKI